MRTILLFPVDNLPVFKLFLLILLLLKLLLSQFESLLILLIGSLVLVWLLWLVLSPNICVLFKPEDALFFIKHQSRALKKIKYNF